MGILKNTDLSVKKLTAEEVEEIGVFISYSRQDKDAFTKLTASLESAGLNVLSDKLIESGTINFHENILRMLLKSTCGIMLYDGMVSPWINFEIGILEGLNKDIFVYAPKEDVGGLPDYLRQYTIVTDIDDLIKKVKSKMLFSDVFENESVLLKKEEFLRNVLPKIGYAYLRLRIPGIKDIDPSAYRLCYLITGLFKLEQKTDRDNTICHKYRVPLSECLCESLAKYGKCAYNEFTLPSNSDAITLNKIYEAILIDDDDFAEFLLPINGEYGNTFKCFMDIKDFTMKEKLIALLVNANIIGYSESDSGVSDRIYFTLPAQPLNGLFKIVDERGIENNYLCPGVLC